MQKKTKLVVNCLNEQNSFKLTTYVNKTNFKKLNIKSGIFSTSIEYKDLSKQPYGMVGYVLMQKLDFYRLMKLAEKNRPAIKMEVE